MSDGQIHEKFIVTRTDGQSAKGQKHHGCRYFVLDLTHDAHAVPALKAYAESCKADRPQLSRSIREELYAIREEPGQ